MASIQLKGRSWYCRFYCQDRRYTFTVNRVTTNKAEATRTDEIIDLLDRGLATERTVEGLWKLCGKIVELFDPVTCKNYISHAGYRYR